MAKNQNNTITYVALGVTTAAVAVGVVLLVTRGLPYRPPGTTTYTITVTATSSGIGTTIPGALVMLDGVSGSGNPAVFTNVSAGSYVVSASASGYQSASMSIAVASNGSFDVPLTLQVVTYTVTLNAVDSLSGATIPGAALMLDGISGIGNPAAFTKVPAGTHTADAAASGYQSNSGSITVSASATNFNIPMAALVQGTLGSLSVSASPNPATAIVGINAVRVTVAIMARSTTGAPMYGVNGTFTVYTGGTVIPFGPTDASGVWSGPTGLTNAGTTPIIYQIVAVSGAVVSPAYAETVNPPV